MAEVGITHSPSEKVLLDYAYIFLIYYMEYNDPCWESGLYDRETVCMTLMIFLTWVMYFRDALFIRYGHLNVSTVAWATTNIEISESDRWSPSGESC